MPNVRRRELNTVVIAEVREHTLSVVVFQEELEDVDVLRAGEGVAANTDTERLAKANRRRLRDSLVRERARARNDA